MEDEVQSDAEFLAQGHAGGGHCAAGGRADLGIRRGRGGRLPMRMAGFLSGLGGALAAIVAMTVTALVRGDHLYMMLGSAACCLVALVKIIAWYAYDKMM